MQEKGLKRGDSILTYWALPIEEVYRTLGSSPRGLSGTEAGLRLSSEGTNPLFRATSTASSLRLFLRQFADPLVGILIFAALISIWARQVTDSIIIISIIMISALLTFFQEMRASKAMEALTSRLVLRTRAIRDGVELEVQADAIVPGDIILLNAGSLIPADGILIEARELHVNQGALTGESFPEEKRTGVSPEDAPLQARKNCLFAGTTVRSGMGKMLVVAVGSDTVYGNIAAKLTRHPDETDFERGLRKFGMLVTRTMILAVFTLLVVSLGLGRPWMESMLFALAIAVAVSPELLPAVLGLTLARGAQKMAKDGVIVRKLNAIESLGSVDVLCSDKTGTLTTGQVKWVQGLDLNGCEDPQISLFAYLNSAFEEGIANPLDQAIRAALEHQWGAQKDRFEKIDEIPYDFQRRRLTLVLEEREGRGKEHLMVMKGAISNVTSACRPLDGPSAAALERLISQSASKGFRVLGLATKTVAARACYQREDETSFDFRGLLIFEDPPHPEAEASLKSLGNLGVRVKIITGDHHQVAVQISDRVGLSICSPLTGQDLQKMTDEVLCYHVEETSLFSEVDPQQKERIVRALKKLGYTVGFLGDGINDAPALHAADVGISVESATDVAREAADILLTEPNLGLITQGIRSGRIIFANTLKYIYTTTSANFGNMITMAVGSIFLPFLPLLANQILLNNFLSDVPALALGNDHVETDRIARPVQWDMKTIRSFMFQFGGISSLFDGITFGVLLWAFHSSVRSFRTAWFIESLLSEIMILFVVRTQKRWFRSQAGRLLIVASLGVGAITFWLPFSPLAKAFEFAPLSGPVLISLAMITLVYAEVSDRLKMRWLEKLRVFH